MFEEISSSITPAKAAQLLGVHIGTIQRWMTSGVRGRRLPSILIGGRRRILIAQLDAFITSNERPASDGNAFEAEAEKRHRAAMERLRSFGVRIEQKD